MKSPPGGIEAEPALFYARGARGAAGVRVLVAVFVVAASAGSALAAAYDDFSRGLAANNLGNNDLAISSFTSALTAGDLAPNYLPEAHLGRATAYARKHQCGEALADANAALKLDPSLFAAHMLRVEMDACVGDQDALMTDIAAGLALKSDSFLYATRASVEWRKGDFAQSAADFAEAAKLKPTDKWFVLWNAAASMRAGSFDAASFASRAEDLGGGDWPGPLVDLYRGETTPERVLKAEQDGDAKGLALRKCQGDVFIGEWRLWNKDQQDATASFQQGIVDCPIRSLLFNVATLELKRPH